MTAPTGHSLDVSDHLGKNTFIITAGNIKPSKITMSESDVPTGNKRQHGEPIIEARDITVSFGMERGESRVVDSVDVDVYKGEILGIIGESGSGKSMLASSFMNAVVSPGELSGEVTYRDQGSQINVLDLSKDELKRFRWERVSMVFQGGMSSFNPTRTIRKHFIETISAHDMEKSSRLEYARQLLDDLYLDPDRVLDSYPHELSGGMAQRALMALSLVLEPNVLIMDEPTAALDLLMQRSIINLISEIKDKYGLTIIFISHNMPLVAELSDRLAVMYAFQLIEMGPTDRILESATHPYTRALLRAVPDIGVDPEYMQPIPGSAPDPVDSLTGCSYAPRCPLADEKCRNTDPEFHEVSEDHVAACFHWEEATAEIPIERQGVTD